MSSLRDPDLLLDQALDNLIDATALDGELASLFEIAGRVQSSLAETPPPPHGLRPGRSAFLTAAAQTQPRKERSFISDFKALWSSSWLVSIIAVIILAILLSTVFITLNHLWGTPIMPGRFDETEIPTLPTEPANMNSTPAEGGPYLPSPTIEPSPSTTESPLPVMPRPSPATPSPTLNITPAAPSSPTPTPTLTGTAGASDEGDDSVQSDGQTPAAPPAAQPTATPTPPANITPVAPPPIEIPPPSPYPFHTPRAIPTAPPVIPTIEPDASSTSNG